MSNFWRKLKKPILVLAPMADVTDVSFRYVIAKYGKPDVMWTEFVSADGLVLAPEAGRKKLLKDLEYSEIERPIVAQLFSSKPDNMRKACALVRELGFDGVDINMGCPDKGIEKQGCGSAMIKNPELAKEIIMAAKEGVGDLPVSVKTRLGYNKDELETWLPELLSANPTVITIHARTRKEMSKVPARWERIKRAVEIRNELKSETLIFGNGDVKDIEDAKEKVKETGCDGIMLGRAIFGNPWLFSKNKNINIKEKLRVLLEHTRIFEEKLGGVKNFVLMKKHFKSYIGEFVGAKDLRTKLMETENGDQVEEIINEFLINFED
ncbi:MAG: tRNA-dihydrouridine synthase [Candidatus Pacebacteria bacterium]|nr:tRNA-dihydrouridine synthase [Candidatus Paceibacterota bacterium]